MRESLAKVCGHPARQRYPLPTLSFCSYSEDEQGQLTTRGECSLPACEEALKLSPEPKKNNK